jgi:general secretion pathway protein A
MLSNLETSTEKLLQIVLIGQPELDKILNLHELRQLKQRIAIRATISLFTEKESIDYIHHRLSRAAKDHFHISETTASTSPIFTDKALTLIAKQARGIPRIINIFCDNALINGYGRWERPVSLKTVQEVIHDMRGGRKLLFRGWKFFPFESLKQLKEAIVDGTEILRGFRLKKSFSFLHLLLTAGIVFLIYLSILVIKEYESPERRVEDDSNKYQSEYESSITQETTTLVNEASATVMEMNVIEAEPDPKSKAEPEPEPIVRIVQKGDTLSDLTSKVYGKTNRYRLVKWVLEHNPHIKNKHKLTIGDRIIFPDKQDQKEHAKQ